MNILAPPKARLGIEIVHDLVCPWCDVTGLVITDEEQLDRLEQVRDFQVTKRGAEHPDTLAALKNLAMAVPRDR